jgi:hypothetical protein
MLILWKHGVLILSGMWSLLLLKFTVLVMRDVLELVTRPLRRNNNLKDFGSDKLVRKEPKI